jgi:hypothetical protein
LGRAFVEAEAKILQGPDLDAARRGAEAARVPFPWVLQGPSDRSRCTDTGESVLNQIEQHDAEGSARQHTLQGYAAAVPLEAHRILEFAQP